MENDIVKSEDMASRNTERLWFDMNMQIMVKYSNRSKLAQTQFQIHCKHKTKQKAELSLENSYAGSLQQLNTRISYMLTKLEYKACSQQGTMHVQQWLNLNDYLL